MDEKEIFPLIRQGFIPGPEEEESAYLARVQKCLRNRAEPEWEEVANITRALFDFAVDWVPLTYDNRGLSFWEGAATWIDTPPRIQMNKRFKKGSYLGLYRRSEVLAHEAVHAARSLFPEQRFEEFFAYRTSASKLRRWLGPLFSSSWKTIAIMGACFLAPYTYFLTLMPIALFLIQLGFDHRTLHQARKNLSPLVKEQNRTWAILLCLTDKEIRLFSRLSPNKIRENLSTSSAWRLKLVAKLLTL